MRKFILFYLLSLLANQHFSQNLNFAEHLGIDESGEIVSIQAKSYYINCSKSGCCYSGVYLNCVNDSGRITNKFNVNLHSINTFGRLIKTNDNCILISAHAIGSCDTGPREDYIAKIDTTGTILFKTAIPNSNSGFSLSITGVTQHQDSSYYLSTSTQLYHYSKNGQFISQLTSGIVNVTALHSLANGNLLMNGLLNGIRKNIIMTPTASIVTQQTNWNVVTKFIETPTYILGRTENGILEKYDSGLIVMNNSSAALNTGNFKIHDFTWQNDTVFVTGTNVSNSTPFYAMLNSALGLYYQTLSNYKGVYPSGISITGKNTIHIATTSNSNSQSQYGFTSIYRFKPGGTFNSNSDIGVIGFSSLNTHLLGNGNLYTTMTPFIETDIQVKNFGNDTVKSFYLNSYAFINTGISYCYILLHQLVESSVAPGAILSIPSVSFYAQPFTLNQPSVTINSKNIHLCVFTSIPNASNDINIYNDSYCDSVLFTTTGISETNLTEEHIQIFPNPFNSEFTIQSEKEMNNYALYNSLGEKIKEEAFVAKEFTIQTDELAPGIYFIHIETEKGVFIKKIVKTN